MNCIYLEASHKRKLFQAKELQQLNDLKQKKKELGMLAKNIVSALTAGILRRNTHAQSISAHVPGTQPPFSNGRRLPGTHAVMVQCYVGRTVSFQDKVRMQLLKTQTIL